MVISIARFLLSAGALEPKDLDCNSFIESSSGLVCVYEVSLRYCGGFEESLVGSPEADAVGLYRCCSFGEGRIGFLDVERVGWFCV